MVIHLLFLFQAAQRAPKPPVRTVPDPGVIATEQRVTPAGLQSVFESGFSEFTRLRQLGTPADQLESARDTGMAR